MRYSKYSGRGNFFSLPNEVFHLGLSAGELSFTTTMLTIPASISANISRKPGRLKFVPE